MSGVMPGGRLRPIVLRRYLGLAQLSHVDADHAVIVDRIVEVDELVRRTRISSGLYDDRPWTTVENVSSVPVSRIITSASLAMKSAAVMPNIGLFSSIGCTTVQLSGKNVTRLRSSVS